MVRIPPHHCNNVADTALSSHLSGSLLVGEQLDDVHQALQQCRLLLGQHYRALVQEERQFQPSMTDWLVRVQQLEEERAGLIE